MQFITVIACGLLNAWGGYSWHNARRFLMPCLLAVNASICSHTWWIGILLLPTMGTLCLGYFGSGNAGRACWIVLQAFMLSIGLFLTGHVAWYFFIPYVIGSGILGGLYKNWYQPLGDMITGSYLGLIILCIR